MALVTVTIDGRMVQAPAGASVLDAARSIGIKIPALCYDPDLSAVGACRLCVVEIDGIRNLPTSCVTTCSEGMVVRTNTPVVLEARKTLLELLIANHPLDCLTCEKSGTCLLQQYCYEYGVLFSPFQGNQHGYAVDTDNPFYVRDMNKCILCGRCIRACEEIVGRKVLDFSCRGFNTAKISEVVPQGTVFSSFHFVETPVNRLTNPKYDPIAKIPELKICAVKVERIA